MASPRLFDRALIRLSATEPGEDVRGFLQGLVTNDTRRLDDGPIWAALLTAQGKALFDFLIWADEADVLIDCEAAQADALIRRLSIYRLRRKIALAVDAGLGVFWSADHHAGHPGEGAGLNAPDPRLPALGQRWIASVQADDSDVAAAWRAHRLAHGVAEGVDELGQDATLWLECNAIELNGVAFDKGCYVGQENTARMNWRQKINRRLVVVPLDQTDAKRQRIAYADLGLSVEHRRVEDMGALDLPDWQRAALAATDPAVADGARLQ